MKEKGFTIIEMIMVLTIIIVLLTVALVFYSVYQRMAEARNTQRVEEARTLLDAIISYQIDHRGNYPPGLDEKLRMLGTSAGECAVKCGKSAEMSEDQCLDLSQSLFNEYFGKNPYDPNVGSLEKSFYAAKTLPGGRAEIIACAPELNAEISVSR